PEPVNGEYLLTDIEMTCRRFLVCQPAIPFVLALWVTATWFEKDVHVAPILSIKSPEKRCGKTTALDLIGRLSKRPLLASNVSPAALYRTKEKYQPTLLVDEADAFFSENEDLRCIVNSGN